MRRYWIVAAVVLFAVCASAVVADEAVLLDFSMLGADIVADQINAEQMTQNRATVVDFSRVAGASYTDEQKKGMVTSLAIPNWEAIIASSSRVGNNVANTYVRPVKVAQDAKQYAGATVLGLRVSFPLEPFNSWARVNPPFIIPAFEPKADVDDTGKITPKQDEQGGDPVNSRLSRFEGAYNADTKITTAYGVVKNVGSIKSLTVSVKGLNFPHGLSVILLDNDNVEHEMFMGYLQFDGWRNLRWDNPQYITDVRNRELRITPLYPRASPFVKIAGFRVTRDAAAAGGDFVVYLKDVKLLYDKAILEPIRDIDDEAVWGIIGQREADRMKMEAQRFGISQVLRYIERLKQETRTEFTNTEAPAEGAPK